MIEKTLLEEILGIAVSTGADFAEVFLEKKRNEQIRLLDKKIDAVLDTTISGVGIRAFVGTNTVFASTSDVSRNGLVACAKSVSEAVGDAKKYGSIVLSERIFPNIHPVRIVPSSAEMKYKTDILREADSAARGYDERISQITANLMSVDRTVQIANTEGLLTSDRHIRTRMAVNATAAANGENQSGFSMSVSTSPIPRILDAILSG